MNVSKPLHRHDYGNKNYVPAALHLAELQAKGKIKHLGVTNFDVPRLAEMVDAGAPIVSNQVQYSLLDRRPENGMVAYCQAHGIQLLPYGTVAGGFLSEKYLGLPPSAVKADTYSLSKYASVVGTVGGYAWLQDLLAALQKVGDKHGVGIAEVASAWVLAKPAVAGVIVGARNADHVAQHRRVFGFELDEADLGRIGGVLDRGVQAKSDCYTWERGAGQW
jgi:aryl-alcohol dehydrogenase-like predicted oxidoreductase